MCSAEKNIKRVVDTPSVVNVTLPGRRTREGILTTAERTRIETVIDLCCKVREQLASQAEAPFRLHVLLDMLLLELGRELARLRSDGTA